MEAEINAFIQSQRLDRGASASTIEAYRRDLRQFAASLPKGTPLARIEPFHLEAFLLGLSKGGMQAASLARKMSALRQFFKFACLELGLATNPAEQLESPSLSQRLPKFLTFEEVQSLLATADHGIPYPSSAADALRARDRAMVYLLYATGLRVSELVSLTPHAVELEQGYVRVRGKGDKERIAPFAPVAGERLLDYLTHHRAALLPPDSPSSVGVEHLFLNHHGQKITRQGFYKILGTLALQSGLRRAVSPHVLRHSFATHLLQSGMNLRSLQMLLGHSDLSTTQIYAHVTPEHLKSTHKKYHPRGGS